MLFYLLFINPRWTHYPLSGVVFAAVGDSFFESKYLITIATAVASTRPTSCQEPPSPQHNIWSQDPRPSSAHAHVRVVAYSAVALNEMTNPKAALESKATAVAASIRPMGSQDFPRPPHNLQSQELGSLTTPAPLYIVVFSAVTF